MGGGQGGQDRHHHQDGHPAQLRTPPAAGVQRGGGGSPSRAAPASPRPPPGHQPRRPRRPGRPRPWAAAWWRACSARAWAAVVRHRLRQRQRRQRAWCGSQPRPRSSTRNGTAAAPARPSAPGRPGGLRRWHAASCRVTTARALAAQGAVAALAGPVNRPQLLGRSRVLAAPLAGRSGGGPLAGLAVGRQPAAAAPVELTRRPDPATPRAALDRGHAVSPQPGRLIRLSRIKGLLPLVPGPGALARCRGRFRTGERGGPRGPPWRMGTATTAR